MIPGLKSIKENLARKRVRADGPTTPKKKLVEALIQSIPSRCPHITQLEPGPIYYGHHSNAYIIILPTYCDAATSGSG